MGYLVLQRTIQSPTSQFLSNLPPRGQSGRQTSQTYFPDRTFVLIQVSLTINSISLLSRPTNPVFTIRHPGISPARCLRLHLLKQIVELQNRVPVPNKVGLRINLHHEFRDNPKRRFRNPNGSKEIPILVFGGTNDLSIGAHDLYFNNIVNSHVMRSRKPAISAD